MVKQEIVYCSDLIKALKEYVKEYGNDRILVDTSTKNRISNDFVSRIGQVPDDDLDDTGYWCYIILEKADKEMW